MTPTARFYFSDPDGNELVDHPLNGVSAWGMGQRVRDRKGREEVRGMIMRGDLETAVGSKKVVITAADFDNKPVIVKFWLPKDHPMGSQTFWLIPVTEDSQKMF